MCDGVSCRIRQEGASLPPVEGGFGDLVVVQGLEPLGNSEWAKGSLIKQLPVKVITMLNESLLRMAPHVLSSVPIARGLGPKAR